MSFESQVRFKSDGWEIKLFEVDKYVAVDGKQIAYTKQND